MGETPADAIEGFLKTWGPNCGAPRSVFEGQLRTLLETVASAAGQTAIAVTDALRAAEAEREACPHTSTTAFAGCAGTVWICDGCETITEWSRPRG